MCGIVGWVDFARDARERIDLLHRLTDTIAHRGPDQDGYFTDRHVALGHRRLSIVDIEGSRQPMVAVEDGRPVAVIVYKSEVYNYRELRAELALAGRRCEGDGDTEVVLQAYLQWGPDFARRLNGIYAFAIWDARVEELLLVRDRIGVKPLYYAPTADGVVFASEPKAILAYPGVAPVVDTDGLRELLSVVKTPGHAVYRAMAEVPPGHVVTVSRAGLRTRCYWRLTAAGHTDDLDTTVARIRALLDDIVARQLVADVPVAMLLSGGLDSSAIAALAARQLAAAGAGPLRTFSLDFDGYLDGFRPDRLRDQPDAPFVAELVTHAGTDHTGLMLSRADLTDAANRRTALAACDLPNGRGDRDTSLMLLFRAVAAHARVVLSGESADELFGGYRWFHDPDAVAADTFGWLPMFGHPADDGPASTTSLLDPLLLKQLDLPGYREAQYRTALAEVPHVDGADATERRMREICYLHLTRMMPVLLDRAERMAGRTWQTEPGSLCRTWTRKEAVVKATGEGIARLRSVDVSADSAVAGGVTWNLYELPAPIGFVAALATEEPLEEVRVLDSSRYPRLLYRTAVRS
jgi:asparagine synthase (glutamine-hydrolysing)